MKWFSSEKGYGFITPDDGSEDVFVHQTEIKSQGFRTLGDNETVEFDIVQDQNGRSKASNVTGPNGADVKGGGECLCACAVCLASFALLLIMYYVHVGLGVGGVGLINFVTQHLALLVFKKYELDRMM